MTPTTDSDRHNPCREVWVAQALIKAVIPGKIEPVYLVQRDGDFPDEYRLIGGRFEPKDGTLLKTMKREIWEELGLEYQKDYVLHKLIHELCIPPKVSPSHGILSLYCFRIYFAKMTRKVCLDARNNRWISKRELLTGQADSGERIAAWHIKAIDGRLPGGLEGLDMSLLYELSSL